MTTITISAAGLDEVKAQFAAMPKQVRLAQRRAIERTGKHVASAVRKSMAAAEGVKPGAVKRRASSRMLRDEVGLVWVGLDPLLPIHLTGSVSQDAGGVAAGPRYYRGAFYRKVYGGQRKVWIRLKSRHFDAETYPYKQRASGSVPAHLRHRFPVVLARVKLDTDAVRQAVRMEADAAGPYLIALLERELAFRASRA